MVERSEEVMATISVGYKTYCMPLDAAVAVVRALATAELYDTKYGRAADGGTTHHIYPQEVSGSLSIQLITADLYRMAKLAGPPKPE